MECVSRATRYVASVMVQSFDWAFMSFSGMKFRAINSFAPRVRRGTAVEIHDDTVPRLYTYGNLRASERVLFMVPGGGFVMDRCGVLDDAMERLSNALGLFIIVCQYRVAPVSKFPAIHDGVRAAYDEACRRFHLESKHVFLGGESVGGSICMDLLTHAREREQAIRGVVLWYASPQMTISTKSSYVNQTPWLNWSDYVYYLRAYTRHPREVNSSRLTPLLGEFAPIPCLYFVSSWDMFRDAQVEFAEMLDAELVTVPHAHGYLSDTRKFREDVGRVGMFMDQHCS